jgi:diacylglycerol kinase (ATP)
MQRDEPSKGMRRLINATRYSIQGIRAAWRHEAAFRQEAIVALVCIPLAFWVGATLVERALLIFSILMILIVELLNSAIEATVDRIGEERHPLSGRAKNMGSAAVLFSLVAAGIVWAMILWQRCG